MLGFIHGAKITNFRLLAVDRGQVFVRTASSTGVVSVDHWHEGIWTRVISTEEKLDGQTLVDFAMYPAGLAGDQIVLAATVAVGRATSLQLYVNGPLGTTTSNLTRLSMVRPQAPAGRLIVEGAPNQSHLLQQSPDLQVWKDVTRLDLDPQGRSEWEMPLNQVVQFYRTQPTEGPSSPD
jgi:hypothetical protein